jgi:hypothetical protein
MNTDFIERRVTNQVCNYWKLKKQDERYPKEIDIDMEEIIELLPYCVIVDIIETKDNIEYKLTYIGEKVKNFYHEKIFTDSLIPFISPIIDTFKERLENLLETQEPIIEKSETIDINQDTVKFRQCFLPLSKDGKKITGALCAITCQLT